MPWIAIRCCATGKNRLPDRKRRLVNADREDACIITVTDTGVDIKANDMKLLFRPFSQIDKGAGRATRMDRPGFGEVAVSDAGRGDGYSRRGAEARTPLDRAANGRQCMNIPSIEDKEQSPCLLRFLPEASSGPEGIAEVDTTAMIGCKPREEAI